MPVNRALERQDTPARQKMQNRIIEQQRASLLALRSRNTSVRNPKLKGTDTFPEGVWEVVFYHLRNPIPAPLSCPDRGEIRQTDLCNALRSCRLFQSICTPLLYRAPITDDLCGFLENRVAKSRRDLLAHVQHLYIEYCEKKADFINYYDLMHQGGKAVWESVEVKAPKENARTNIIACDIELEGTMNVLQDINLSDYYTSEILPNLKTIAVSSIYGIYSDHWTLYDQQDPDSESGDDGSEDHGDTNLTKVKVQFDIFLSTSNVKHCCIREHSGPLSLRAISARPNSPSHRPLTTIHFGGHSDVLCLRIGQPTRWMSDVLTDHSWRDIYEWVTMWIAQLAGTRNEVDRRSRSIHGTFHLNVYWSTRVFGSLFELKAHADDHRSSIPRLTRLRAETPGDTADMLSDDTQRAMAWKIGARITQMMRQESRVEDIVNCYASCDTPTCEACGSGVPA